MVPLFCWMKANVSSSFWRASRPFRGFAAAAAAFATRRVWSHGVFSACRRGSATMAGTAGERGGLKGGGKAEIPENREGIGIAREVDAPREPGKSEPEGG